MNIQWLALGLSLAAALPVQAQKIVPGLWEYSMTMKGQQGGQMEAAQAQMQAQMASMPPEQRKKIEAMMAQRGVQMGGPGKPMVVKTCVTPEQASRDMRDEVPQHDSNCKQVSKSRSGNTMKFKFECGGERPSSGEGEYTFVSDKEMKGHVVVNTTVKGKPETMEMDNAGRWLGADCGDIKPRVKK